MLLYSYLTKFTANRKYDLKINEQLRKGQVPRIHSIKLKKMREREGGGGHPPPPSLVRARVNPQTGTFIISHKRGTIWLFVSFLFIVLLKFALLCFIFIFAFYMTRLLELGK